MVKRQVTFRNEGREKLYSGISKLAEAVGSTLGAKGQTVLYEFGNEPGGVPLVTKDGVTVAKQIAFDCPLENLGANLIKEAAKKTVQRAGDGTTTSTVLTHAILDNAGLETNLNFQKGLEAAYNEVIKYLEDNSIEVDEEMLKHVAMISTNNDKELGGLIAEAIDKAGEHGTVGWEVNLKSSETYVDLEEGAKIEAGFVDPGFVNEQGKQLMAFDNPYVFVTSAKIQDIEQIKPAVAIAIEKKRPIVIIGDLDPKVSVILLNNVRQNNMEIGVVRPPSFGPLRQELMEDISDLLGCELHGYNMGDDVDVDYEPFLGSCKQLMSTNTHTILRFDEKPDLSDKVSYIKEQIDSDETTMRKNQLKQRLAMLAGAIGNIYVWAPSEIELKEKYDRVEDAVYAVYAAKEMGILPGGGVALKNAAEAIGTKKEDTDYNKGWNSFIAAISAPFNKILTNAGLEIPKTKLKQGMGIDVLQEKVVNMIDTGIIDPAKITKQALTNAFSVAKTILNTNVIINNIEGDNQNYNVHE